MNKIEYPIIRFYVKSLTDKRTDKQTNKRQIEYNSIGGGN